MSTSAFLAGCAVGCVGAVVATTAVLHRRQGKPQHPRPTPAPALGHDADGVPDSKDHAHCRSRIFAERQGRIAAERAIRTEVVKILSQQSVGFPMLAIGEVHSPYVGKRGTPRQGMLVVESRGYIELRPEIPTEALEGLDGYSHLYVHFIFHDNTNLSKVLLRSAQQANNPGSNSGDGGKEEQQDAPTKKQLSSRTSTLRTQNFTKTVPQFAAKVCPPLLNGANIGVLATRSPHHPNPLGQSLVKIESVDVPNRRIHISGFDMCDRSPVIDLKPWNPSDCPRCLHALVDHAGDTSPAACTSNEDRCAGMFVPRVPDWVEAGVVNAYELPVELTQSVIDQLRTIVDASSLEHYPAGSFDLLHAALKHILALDIRSFHQGRGRRAGVSDSELVERQRYELEFDRLRFGFAIVDGGRDETADGETAGGADEEKTIGRLGQKIRRRARVVVDEVSLRAGIAAVDASSDE